MGGTAANRITSAGSGIDGATLGKTGGAETETLDESELGPHDHPFGTNNNVLGSGVDGDQAAEGSFLNTNNAGGGQAHQNTQPSLVQKHRSSSRAYRS